MRVRYRAPRRAVTPVADARPLGAFCAASLHFARPTSAYSNSPCFYMQFARNLRAGLYLSRPPGRYHSLNDRARSRVLQIKDADTGASAGARCAKYPQTIFKATSFEFLSPARAFYDPAARARCPLRATLRCRLLITSSTTRTASQRPNRQMSQISTARSSGAATWPQLCD